MGTSFALVNVTRRERIAFHRLPASTAREIAGVPSSAVLVTWYMLQHPGDHITFVPDDGSSPLTDVSADEAWGFPDRTEAWIDAALEAGLLVDCGRVWEDEDDPGLYLRDLRNAWMPPGMLAPPPPGEESGG